MTSSLSTRHVPLWPFDRCRSRGKVQHTPAPLKGLLTSLDFLRSTELSRSTMPKAGVNGPEAIHSG